MASNGLVTNATKTALLLLNSKNDIPLEINIGTAVINKNRANLYPNSKKNPKFVFMFKYVYLVSSFFR